jgi:predicted DNA-binding transcriptional regulator AlpA
MAIRKIYRPCEVDQIFGWSPSTRKRKIQSGELKPPIRLGPQMTGFPEEHLEEYRERLLAESDTKAVSYGT